MEVSSVDAILGLLVGKLTPEVSTLRTVSCCSWFVILKLSSVECFCVIPVAWVATEVASVTRVSCCDGGGGEGLSGTTISYGRLFWRLRIRER